MNAFVDLSPTHLALYTAIAAVLAYIVGSIPFAIITSKLFGLQDPRQFGSGNPGATNVLRSGNKKAAVLTLIGDAFKGWLAVFIAQQLFPHYGTTIAIVAVAAFLGHIYSIFLGFKGGKGVATAIGVLLALSPLLALTLILIWLLMAVLFRYSSLAAIVAAAAAPLLYLQLYSYHLNNAYLVAILFISIVLIYKHKANIQKLLAGKESKIGSKKK
ncbi:MAG: glycerol-3-phosphate 1-O-acyltransferase PlsY [Pelistega sp.]|nr:glycerol-3-phosphate 1-O-acyltransferase PlsY [Pelistega sp.]